MRVELVDDYPSDDYQLPKISSTSASSAGGLNRDASNRDAPNNETHRSTKEPHSVRRDISQDSLDEQPNGCDYIGINSTLNCSTLNNGLGASTVGSKFSAVSNAIGEHKEHKHSTNSVVASPVDRHPIDKPHGDRSQISRNFYDQITVDRNPRNVDKEKQQQTKPANEYACKIYQHQPPQKPNNEQHRNLVNSTNFMPATKASNQSTTNHLTSTQSTPFEVPVLIETPCTPEPPADEECSTESNSEPPTAGNTTPQNTNSSFDNESENNLSKRKRTKRRIENPEEIDALFNGRHILVGGLRATSLGA